MAPLFLLKGTLHFHLILKAIDELNLSLEKIFIVPSLAPLLIVELAVAALFLLLDLLTVSLRLFLLTLAKKLNVLGLKGFICEALVVLARFTLLLLSELLVELTTDELTTFHFTSNCLFLLLVVQKGVKLLNGGPLVLLCELRENLTLGGLARSYRVRIATTSTARTNAHRLRAALRASNGSGIAGGSTNTAGGL